MSFKKLLIVSGFILSGTIVGGGSLQAMLEGDDFPKKKEFSGQISVIQGPSDVEGAFIHSLIWKENPSIKNALQEVMSQHREVLENQYDITKGNPVAVFLKGHSEDIILGQKLPDSLKVHRVHVLEDLSRIIDHPILPIIDLWTPALIVTVEEVNSLHSQNSSEVHLPLEDQLEGEIGRILSISDPEEVIKACRESDLLKNLKTVDDLIKKIGDNPQDKERLGIFSRWPLSHKENMMGKLKEKLDSYQGEERKQKEREIQKRNLIVKFEELGKSLLRAGWDLKEPERETYRRSLQAPSVQTPPVQTPSIETRDLQEPDQTEDSSGEKEEGSEKEYESLFVRGSTVLGDHLSSVFSYLWGYKN